MPFQDITTPAVLPVFVLEKWVPDGSTVYDICLAAEKVTGPASIDGATCIKGLWRVYPLNEVARIKLLTKGVTMGNKLVRFEGMNPFRRGDGAEKSGTRLMISNSPFSYSNEAVARNLSALGLKLRSKITFEKARGPDRMLTDWRTGRRSVWIDLPQTEVNRYCKMGDFSAVLFYKEMKASIECRRCFEKGHMARECPNEELCLDCKKPGHRRGHPDCDVWGQRNDNEGNDAEEYIWGSLKGNSASEISEDEDAMDDNESDKSDGVSGEDLTSNSDEDQEKEEDNSASRGVGIVVGEVKGIEQDQSSTEAEEKQSEDTPHEVSKLTDGTQDKTCSTGETLAKTDGNDGTDGTNNIITNLSVKGGNSIKKPITRAETPKSKPKQKKKQKVKKMHQPSIEKFVAGKRPLNELSSLGDDKSGSPDEKSQKTNS